MTDSVEVDVVPNSQPGGSLEAACSQVLQTSHARCPAVIVHDGLCRAENGGNLTWLTPGLSLRLVLLIVLHFVALARLLVAIVEGL